MRRLVKRISLPLLVLIGLILIGQQTAEAGHWRRHADVPTSTGTIMRRAVVYAAPVPVYAPVVGVHVVPRRVRVYSPGVWVNVGPAYPSYYGAYYYGW